MTAKAREALEIGLQLDREERARLVAQLIASLDDEVEVPADWDEAWGRELDRRSQAAEDGTARWIPEEEALRTIFRRPPS